MLIPMLVSFLNMASLPFSLTLIGKSTIKQFINVLAIFYFHWETLKGR